MATPKWDNLGDGFGHHHIIHDRALQEAEPYEYSEEVDGYHEKHVRESNGKLLVKGKNGKMRRTAAGEGLFRSQMKLNNKIMGHNRARLMKRTAATKAYFKNHSRKDRLHGLNFGAYGVADAPSPQNINAVRRRITVKKNKPATDKFPTIQEVNGKLEIPANVSFKFDTNQVMVTVQDGTEPGTEGEHPEQNSKEKTIMFATHGVVNLACDARVMETFRIGDVVYATTEGMNMLTSGGTQANISSSSSLTTGSANKIGIYLGPCTSNKRGGIVVRLDGEQ